MRSSVRALLSVLTSLATTATLSAQGAPPPADTTDGGVPRWLVGVAADIGQPLGEFRQRVKNGAGAQGHVLLRLDRAGLVALRLQAGWLNYGHESRRLCLAATPGCRVEVNVTTANGILSWGAGPQLVVPLGPVRAYGYGVVGVSRVATVSGIGGGLVPDIVAGDENFGDSGFSWSGAVGLQLPVRRHTSLDVSVAYQGNGRRNYVLEGGVTDRPDGSLTFDLRQSKTDLLAIRVGATAPIPWGRQKCRNP